jgi:23S rRNA (cytidine1920-2'-O)/16S rRNA (cytidine1409-2'-O)-methyltransferase
VLLVARGLARSREEAQRLVLAGEVRIDDRPARKSSEGVADDARVVVGARPKYVSRGGDKLAGALDAFALDVTGATAIDVGASTGGFTDCLLRRGARRVYAVDVGYGQLDWRLRNDRRVVAIERQNIRELSGSMIPHELDLAVIDVSFISLRLVFPVVHRLLSSPARIVALVKPQFEVGKGNVGKGGVVRDPRLHEAAVSTVRDAGRALGWMEGGFVESPLRGSKGNCEFFLYWNHA